MQLGRARFLPFALVLVLCSAGLAGCFPSVERQYFASTGVPHGLGVSAGCSVPGDAQLKLPAGVRVSVQPPQNPDKKGESASVNVLLPAGHTGHFSGDAVLLSILGSSEEWHGSLLGSGNSLSDPVTKRVTYSQDVFAAQAEVRGGSADDVFFYVVRSDRVFPKEFSVQLPDFVIDGNSTAIPEVHFRYGRGLALCGCCGV